jgi:hypothetical protein
VGVKPYGANRNNEPAKENKDLTGTIVAESVDLADGTPTGDTEVYAVFQHAKNPSPNLTVNIKRAHSFREWRCTWTEIS